MSGMSVQSNHHASSSSVLLCNSNKNKKSKTDVLRFAVGALLKQKNFVNSEKFRKSELILSQNKTNFIFQKMIDSDVQKPNSFLYSNVLCLTNNYTLVDQNFERFSQFVESQTDELRSELKRFYAPLLCHIYFELIKARETKGAIDFMRKYAHLVATVDTYEAPFPTKINGCSISANDGTLETSWQHLNIRFAREACDDEDAELDYFMKLIQKLSACQKLEVLETDADIIQFRSTKYELHTTQEVVNVLKNFLEKRGHIVIFQIIMTWIHVHILDNELNNLSEENIFTQAEACNDDDKKFEQMSFTLVDASVIERTGGTKRSSDDITDVTIKEESCNDPAEMPPANSSDLGVASSLKKLKACSDQIYKMSIELPQVIKIADRAQGLTSASLDAKVCHLVAGFNNSNIRLWQMNQHVRRGQHVSENLLTASCPWSSNNVQVPENVKHAPPLPHTEADFYIEKYYERKYEENSYNAYGGVSLRGHGSGVTDVKFSDHYPVLFSTSKDTCLRCWRAENFNCSAIYRGHRYPIWCMDESPVGMYVATGSKDLTARLWCLDREFPLITYAGHTQDVECLAFHPNGNYLATGSADFSVRLWCVTSGKLMRVFVDCKQPVCCIAFSPNGKMLAAGGEESKIRIFDLAAGSQLHELKDHSSNVVSISWDPNGHYLASGCRDGTIRVWDVQKLTHAGDSNSPSSSTGSTSVNRLLCIPTTCQRLVKVSFVANETICCLGTSDKP